MFRTLYKLLILLVCTASCMQWARSQEKSLQQQIQDLEARLRQIEQAQGTKTAGKASAAITDDNQAAQVEEIRRQLNLLAAEVEKIRSGEPEEAISSEQAAALGLGASASSVYRKKQGVSIAGYGEMLYQNFSKETQAGEPANKGSRFDFLRAIIYAGYRFNEKFIFNSELEFEHANTGKGGEAAVEFAYLDYMARKNLSLRGGLLLIPMGLTNEYHEPTSFIGARRSETESRIIPTTWRENGFGVLGSAGKLSYRAYLVAGLDASGFSSDGIRGGRQEGSESRSSDMAFVGRLDVTPTPGVILGGSIYSGGSGQGQFAEDGKTFDINTTIGEVHAQVQARGFDIRGLFSRAVIDDAAALNRLRNLSGSDSIGESMQGGYVQFGYNLLSQYHERLRLTPYYRFEKLNTQNEVPPGFESDPASDRTFHTFGIEFRPIPNVAVKGEYQWIRNLAKSGFNQLNINLGYNF